MVKKSRHVIILWYLKYIINMWGVGFEARTLFTSFKSSHIHNFPNSYNISWHNIYLIVIYYYRWFFEFLISYILCYALFLFLSHYTFIVSPMFILCYSIFILYFNKISWFVTPYDNSLFNFDLLCLPLILND